MSARAFSSQILTQGKQHSGSMTQARTPSFSLFQSLHTQNNPFQGSYCRSFSRKSGDPTDITTSSTSEIDSAAAPTTTLGEENNHEETQEFQIPGAQAGGKKLAIVYTCTVCDTRSIKQFSEHSYQNGVVLVRCPGCQNLHLIADRLGVFDGDGDWDIQKAMAKMGENVQVVNNENVLEMSVEDLVGQDTIEKLKNNETVASESMEDNDKKS